MRSRTTPSGPASGAKRTVATGWWQWEDGVQAYSELVTIDVATGQRGILVSEDGYDYGDPSYAPDGQRIVTFELWQVSRRATPRWIGRPSRRARVGLGGGRRGLRPINLRGRRGHWPRLSTHSTSTRAPRGSAATPKAARAG